MTRPVSGKKQHKSSRFGSRVMTVLAAVLLAQAGVAVLFQGSLIGPMAVLLLGFAGILIVWRLHAKHAAQIRSLSEQVQSAATEERTDFPILSDARDEIGMLAEHFNDMLSRSERLFQAQYQMRDSVKRAELQVLQAQINPHFLYNTLDMIHWLALNHGASDISRAVENLSSFYRFSLGMGESKVPVEKELMHVQVYVNVQNIRYGDKITLVLSVPEELLHYRIVKIIFQPLVENSIQHGIRAREDGRGTIEIKGHRDERGIHFSVRDDGVGMDQERLKAIVNGSAGKSGYGVDNINKRLILNYGAEHGLSYESVLGIGTTARFSVPYESPLDQLESGEPYGGGW